MGSIDYEKYINMNERQLLNSLLNAQKKEAKIKQEMEQKLKETSTLVKFLKARLKASIDNNNSKFYTLETSPAIKEIKKWEAENPQEAEKIRQDLEVEMKGYYDNSNTKKS